MINPDEELRQEILELIWVAREENRDVDAGALEKELDVTGERISSALEYLEQEGIIVSVSNSVDLTETGTTEARQVIRSHRLAERLLNDVLEVDLAKIEGPACQFEHAISAEVEDKICTLLGHPDHCPHGKVIPEGECCSRSQQVVERAILPLSEVETGLKVNVAYLSLDESGRLERLSNFGILPGVSVKVEQKFPAFVVTVEETSIAMEEEIAGNIFVRNNTGQQKKGFPRKEESVDESIFRKLTKQLTFDREKTGSDLSESNS